MSDMGERWRVRELTISDAVTLDSNGAATIELGPPPALEEWVVERLAVTTTGNTPSVRLYRDSVRADNFVDGTSQGTSNVAEYSTPLRMRGGDLLILVWSGGSPGARASIVGQGQRRRR